MKNYTPLKIMLKDQHERDLVHLLIGFIVTLLLIYIVFTKLL